MKMSICIVVYILLVGGWLTLNKSASEADYRIKQIMENRYKNK